MTKAQRHTILEARQRAFIDRAGQFLESVHAGSLTPVQWFEQTADELKGLYISAYITGKNADWQTMTPTDWGRLGPLLRDQYTFLRQWQRELEVNAEGRTTAQMQARLRLYAASSAQAFSRGYAADRGFDPNVLPAHPGDGRSQCRTNCKCQWRIVTKNKAQGNFDVSWRLGRAERHCKTCPQRARHRSRGGWQGLRIRGGVLIDIPSVIYN